MSAKDHALLKAAGISTSDAAKLFGRSRQALYQGLSQKQHDYFSARDAIVMLQNAKRKDSDRLEDIVRFIETNYEGTEESPILLPDRVTYDQLKCALSDADRIKLLFNGNLDHLSPKAAFLRLLKLLSSTERKSMVNLVIPHRWVENYIKEDLGLTILDHQFKIHVVSAKDVQFLPSLIMTARRAEQRAFIFGKHAIEEIAPNEAAKLWDHVEALCREHPAIMPSEEPIAHRLGARRKGTSRHRQSA